MGCPKIRMIIFKAKDFAFRFRKSEKKIDLFNGKYLINHLY